MVDNVNILRYWDKEGDSLLKQLCKDWVDNLAVKFWNHTSLCLIGYGKGSLKKEENIEKMHCKKQTKPDQ